MSANHSKCRLYRGVIVRLLFYGLFLVGPCTLTESHALHTLMKQKRFQPDGGIVDEKSYQKCQRKVRMLDAIGASAIIVWFAWLGLAVAASIKNIIHERRLTRKSNSLIVSPQKHQP